MLFPTGIRGLAGAVAFWSATAAAVGPGAETFWRATGMPLEAPPQSTVAGPLRAVRLTRALDETGRASLESAGLSVRAALGESIYLIAGSDEAFGRWPRSAPAVSHATPITPNMKVHPALREPESLGAISGGGARADAFVPLYVRLGDGIALDAASLAEIERLGATIEETLTTQPIVVIRAPLSSIDALAALNDVIWIEPALPMLQEAAANNSNRYLTGANVAQGTLYNLTGQGVTVLVYDGGRVRTTHQEFTGRLTSLDLATVSNHSTHVAGTIGGSGATTGGVRRGMAPGVQLLTAGISVPSTGVFLFTSLGDLDDDFVAGAGMGAEIANASLGTNIDLNGFPCSWQGDYGLIDSVIDGYARGTLGAPMIVVWAGGNERQYDDCDIEGFGDFYSIAPPAGAKNAITVGAVNSNDDSMTPFSSWGPTDDGRLKPDIVAPGCQEGSDNGVTSAGSASDTATSTLCGTSQAAPTVTGLVALLLEHWRSKYPTSADPRPATVKALLANTAQDLLSPGPDYCTGFGSVRIVPALEAVTEGRFRERAISHGATWMGLMSVVAGSGPLKFTLAWDDAPAVPLTSKALVNDLDLVLIGPSGQTYYPWTLDPSDPNDDAQTSGPDRLNNVEQVYVEDPDPGVWTVKVIGTSIPDGPQDYSLAMSHQLINRALLIELTDGVPQELEPEQTATIPIAITRINDFIISGSEKVFWRVQGDPTYTVEPLTHLAAGGGPSPNYVGHLPPLECGQVVEFYFQAQASLSGVVTNPPAGAAAPLVVPIGMRQPILLQDFESDFGWTPSGNATAGQWDRGVPVDDTQGAPGVDADGSGKCWQTGNQVGNSDVDGGSAILTSPSFDLSGALSVEFFYWYADHPFLGTAGDEDSFIVEYSADAGPWTEAFVTHAPAAWWRQLILTVGQDLPASSDVRFRLTATDAEPGSVIEAGFDAFAIDARPCGSGCLADFNNDGVANGVDVGLFLNGYFEHDPIADLNGDGVFNGIDIGIFLAAYAAGC